MAGVFSRAFAPSQLVLLQLPTSLRQCTSLHASLLARQTTAGPCTLGRSIRLFHASPLSGSRKPKSAVVKPNTALPPRQRPSSPPKKTNLAFQPHPSTTITHDAPTSSSPQDAIAHPDTQLQQTPKQSPVAYNGRPTPPSPAPYHPPAVPYHAFIEKLALSPEPTVLYTSQSQNLYVGVCYTSALFLGGVAAMTWSGYALAMEQGGLPIVAAAVLFSGIWFVFSCYLAYGPVNIIKRIVAVPAKPSLRITSQQLKPTLRLEPLALVFGKYPKPFEVKMGDVMSDRSFAREVERLARFKAQQAPHSGGVLAEFFSWVPHTFNAFFKMFARPQRFTYVRVGRANFKLDLDACQILDDGKSLDQLIKVDSKPIHVVEKAIRTLFKSR